MSTHRREPRVSGREGGRGEGGNFSFVCIAYLVFVLSGTVAFVGSHLDVVPANPETWERNPFKLVVEVGTYLLGTEDEYFCLSNL